MNRFWAKVDVRGPDECWPWLGCVGSDGYGHFKLNGKPVPAHRVAAGIEGEAHGRHTCDTPLCCNPAHVVEGTHKQNMEDKVARGRHRSPRPGNGRTKLQPEHRAEIVRLFDAGQNKSEIARRFGVTPTRIRQVIHGQA